MARAGQGRRVGPSAAGGPRSTRSCHPGRRRHRAASHRPAAAADRPRAGSRDPGCKVARLAGGQAPRTSGPRGPRKTMAHLSGATSQEPPRPPRASGHGCGRESGAVRATAASLRRQRIRASGSPATRDEKTGEPAPPPSARSAAAPRGPPPSGGPRHSRDAPPTHWSGASPAPRRGAPPGPRGPPRHPQSAQSPPSTAPPSPAAAAHAPPGAPLPAPSG